MLRSKCRLADSEHRDVDLRQFEDIITATVNATVPDKNPKVYKDHFSTDLLSQHEAVALGRALSKIPELHGYGKTVTIFRLFDGRICSDEVPHTPIRPKRKVIKGGHQ